MLVGDSDGAAKRTVGLTVGLADVLVGDSDGAAKRTVGLTVGLADGLGLGASVRAGVGLGLGPGLGAGPSSTHAQPPQSHPYVVSNTSHE